MREQECKKFGPVLGAVFAGEGGGQEAGGPQGMGGSGGGGLRRQGALGAVGSRGRGYYTHKT